jgi:hypothetical protein
MKNVIYLIVNSESIESFIKIISDHLNDAFVIVSTCSFYENEIFYIQNCSNSKVQFLNFSSFLKNENYFEIDEKAYKNISIENFDMLEYFENIIFFKNEFLFKQIEKEGYKNIFVFTGLGVSKYFWEDLSKKNEKIKINI